MSQQVLYYIIYHGKLQILTGFSIKHANYWTHLVPLVTLFSVFSSGTIIFVHVCTSDNN